MKALRIVAIVIVAYAAMVVAFESAIGYFQPADESTLVITTFDGDGVPHDRVVSPIESDGQLYVASNHWTRSWYRRAREKPEVRVTLEGKTGDYRAVPVDGAEQDRVASENRLGMAIPADPFPPSTAILRPEHSVAPETRRTWST